MTSKYTRGRQSGNGNNHRGNKRGARKKRKKTGWVWLFFLVLVAAVCVVVGYLLVILNGERILSENLNKLSLSEASIIEDRNGVEVAKLYVAEGNREYVSINDIPKLVRDTFVAVEDKRFYEHSGVDLVGIGRAIVKDILSMSAKEGASTITQQVARNLFLNADKTLFRKGTEASIALALERHKSKDQILELYLNRIYFGKGQYGIKTAAQYYFGKDITSKDKSQQLEIWEIATLAALPKAPSTYNPVANPEKSKERRAVVLTIMRDQGLITAEEAEAAKKVDYKPRDIPASNQQYQSYIDYVLEEAKEVTGLDEEELLTGGYTIKTAIDTQAQSAMESVFQDDSMFDESVDENQMQGAMVIMDQHDGSIIAMVGGRDYQKQGWNRVTKPRQPGSAFKPITVYGPALESGEYHPWSILRDDKRCYDNGKYCPTDSNKVKYIGPVTMTQAIKESRNQPAVWLLNEMGVQKGLEFAARLGFKLNEKEDRNLAIALGGLTEGVSPLEMARAYGAFANGGVLQEPHTILAIENKRGRNIYKFEPKKAERVMKAETASAMTQMLLEVTSSGGTGTKARISGRDVAGKTGTTQHGIPGLKSDGVRDIWFVGYTPELTGAVWMGYDKTDADHLVSFNSSQAAAMFSKVMSKALEGKAKKTFPLLPDKAEPPEEQQPAVTGLTAAYSPEHVAVELQWAYPAAKDGTTYKIYRKTEGNGDFVLLAETVETAFEDLMILPEQTYTYYVTAFDPETQVESPPSDSVTLTIDPGQQTDSPPEPELPLPEPGDGEPQMPGSDEGADNPDASGSPGDGTDSQNGENGQLPGVPDMPPTMDPLPGIESLTDLLPSSTP